jgi:thymidylate kinase
MFILLNGAFGIGKTTVASLLVRDLPDTAIYDPERVGYVLRRLPPWLLALPAQPADYQDLALWRTLIGRGARRRHRTAARVVVPMAFTNLAYLDAFAAALSPAAPVHRFCLVAPLEVVRERLQERARLELRDVSDFERCRSEECVAAHTNPAFGFPIDATRAPDVIAKDIRQAVQIQANASLTAPRNFPS